MLQQQHNRGFTGFWKQKVKVLVNSMPESSSVEELQPGCIMLALLQVRQKHRTPQTLKALGTGGPCSQTTASSTASTQPPDNLRTAQLICPYKEPTPTGLLPGDGPCTAAEELPSMVGSWPFRGPLLRLHAALTQQSTT